MKYIKSYSEMNEEIGLPKAIVGAAIGAASLLGSPAKAQDTAKTEISVPSSGPDIKGFIDSMELECPEIFVDSAEASTIDTVKPISFLERRLAEYCMQNPSARISLGDLSYVSEKEVPFKINYFYIRGLDGLNGPMLMPIVNFSYKRSAKIAGHEVMFNFTRITGVSTLGATISF